MDIADPVSFFKTHVATCKSHFELEMTRFLQTIHVGMVPAGARMNHLIKEQSDSDKIVPEVEVLRAFLGHMVRYGIIHTFTVLDEYALRSLEVYGRLSEQAIDYSNDEGGAAKILPQFLSQAAKRSLSHHLNRLDFFLTLRNNFAHASYVGQGVFGIDARKDSFESQLKRQKGFQLTPSHHATKDGKPGYAIGYCITGEEPLNDLIAVSKEFYARVLDDLEAQLKAKEEAKNE